MIERLINIENRYNELMEEVAKPETLSNVKRTLEITKEQALIREAYEAYQEYKRLDKEITDARELAKDPELGEMAREELAELEAAFDKLNDDLEIILLPKDPNDDKNVIVEIRGAAGGDEGNIFAGDLYDMYKRYAEGLGYKVELMDATEGSAGGFALIAFMIKGQGAYSKFKYESGAHRVQRVPETETQGRVHTSTATVIVMPEAEEFEVEIRTEDLRIDIFRSGGAGGQSVNTTDSAVRITHIPTGIVVSCQNERSQLQNKEKAMQILRSRIYEEEQRKHEEAMDSERKNKIGTGDRSEKIRTYNYPQNRVTDHRINFSVMSLDRVMQGALNEIVEALITEDQARKLRGE